MDVYNLSGMFWMMGVPHPILTQPNQILQTISNNSLFFSRFLDNSLRVLICRYSGFLSIRRNDSLFHDKIGLIKSKLIYYVSSVNLLVFVHCLYAKEDYRAIHKSKVTLYVEMNRKSQSLLLIEAHILEPFENKVTHITYTKFIPLLQKFLHGLKANQKVQSFTE